MEHTITRYILILAAIFPALGIIAQPVADSIYLSAKMTSREFDKQSWQQITEGIDYSGAFEEDEVDEEDEGEGIGTPYDNSRGHSFTQDSSGSIFWAGFFKVLFIILAIITLAVLAYHVLGSSLRRPRNPKVKAVHSQVTIETIEDKIHESDLDRFLNEAIAAGDYRLALRLYYLAVIKELSLRKAIKWKREKTNRQYLAELRHSAIFDAFREATQIFERSWYGDAPLAVNDFRMLQPKLQQLVLAAKNMNPSTPTAVDGK